MKGKWLPAQVWPEAQFPLQEVGRIVLNENVANFFNENEQLAFSAAHVPPGTPSTRMPLSELKLPATGKQPPHAWTNNLSGELLISRRL